ncbi:MAG: hypothetical protein FJ095_11510 [Deltaproteobacteria bacterium]|nr:hypothetical protein [Deltaproteobacteria bacterium]
MTRPEDAPSPGKARRSLGVLALAASGFIVTMSGCMRPVSSVPQVTERALRTVGETVEARRARPSLTAAFRRAERPDGSVELRLGVTWLSSCTRTRQVLVENTTVTRDSEPDTAGNVLATGFGAALLGSGAVAIGHFGATLPSQATDCRPDAGSECFDPAAAAVGVGVTLATLGAIALGGGIYGLVARPEQTVAVDERVVETVEPEQRCGEPVELHDLTIGIEPTHPGVADARVDGSGAATLILPAGLPPSKVVVRGVPTHLEARVDEGAALGWTSPTRSTDATEVVR